MQGNHDTNTRSLWDATSDMRSWAEQVGYAAQFFNAIEQKTTRHGLFEAAKIEKNADRCNGN